MISFGEKCMYVLFGEIGGERYHVCEALISILI